MVLPNRQAKITDFVKKTYCDYFGVKAEDQDNPFAPHVCYKTCVRFAIPVVWRKGKDHFMDCYFCMINLKGINCKKHHVQYPDVPSAIRPIPPSPNFTVSEPDGNMEYGFDSEHGDMTMDDAYKPEKDNQPVPLTLAEIIELT